ncbi:MAG: N-acetylglucosamine-6-phosphate deacetylase [Clostridia bacterium]|nr:N-acetylglucosamine-6-phosphate deacetylase [Clostridia bacterium]
MKILLQNCTLWQPDCRFESGVSVFVENDTVVAVGKDAEKRAYDVVYDLGGARVIPGLVDVHTHGRAGKDFSTATKEEMEMLRLSYARQGVTSVFPTLASGTDEEWQRAIDSIQACGFDGIHLEGRYLNPQKRGAHPLPLLSLPDAKDLEHFLSRIAIPCHVSAALELDEDGSFTKAALAHGATVGLGHTNATAEQTKLALARGASSFTHLFNTMPPLHHREGGVLAIALQATGYAELIADGIHVCPDVVSLAYHCLGKEHLVLVTDSMEATGCPDGDYTIAGQPVRVENGIARTAAEGALAGSTLELWQGVRNLMRFASVSLEDAVRSATLTPAKMVGIDGKVGTVETGKKANLVILDDALEIAGVLLDGNWIIDPNGGK